MTDNDPGNDVPADAPDYDTMNTAELKQLATERNVAGRSSMSREELVAALQADPWGTPPEETPKRTSQPSDSDLSAQFLDPLHANPLTVGGATNPGLAADNEPQITVRTAEGTNINVPASLQGQYEEMGFEVVVGADAFGENGTITVGADPEQVAFGELERKQAQSRLGLRS